MSSTQGPWHIFSIYAQHEVRTPTGGLVAVAQSREHARLIAAAPELLDALHQLDEAFCADDYGTREGRERGRAALIAARAARAKATGSASHG